MAVEEEGSAVIREGAVEGGGVGPRDERAEPLPGGVEGIVLEGDGERAESDADRPGPVGDGRAQGGGELIVGPALVLHLVLAHPRRPGRGQAVGEPGVVVAHEELGLRRAEQAIEALGGVGADADGVAGVEDRIAPGAGDGGQHGLERRQVRVGVGDDGDTDARTHEHLSPHHRSLPQLTTRPRPSTVATARVPAPPLRYPPTARYRAWHAAQGAHLARCSGASPSPRLSPCCSRPAPRPARRVPRAESASAAIRPDAPAPNFWLIQPKVRAFPLSAGRLHRRVARI